MPSVNERQRKMMGIALAIKKKKIPRSYSRQASKMASEMSEAQLEEFARSIKKKSRKRG